MAAEHGPHIPPDRRTSPARVGDDLVIHAPEIAKKGVVLPFVAEEVAGEGHLGKEHKRRPGRTRLIDTPQDPGEVHLGVARDHLHLANDDRAIGGRTKRRREAVSHRGGRGGDRGSAGGLPPQSDGSETTPRTWREHHKKRYQIAFLTDLVSRTRSVRTASDADSPPILPPAARESLPGLPIKETVGQRQNPSDGSSASPPYVPPATADEQFDRGVHNQCGERRHGKSHEPHRRCVAPLSRGSQRHVAHPRQPRSPRQHDRPRGRGDQAHRKRPGNSLAAHPPCQTTGGVLESGRYAMGRRRVHGSVG